MYPTSDALSGVTKNGSVVASSDVSRFGVVWNVVVVGAVVGLNFLSFVVVVVAAVAVVAVASGSSSSSS